MGMPLVVHCFHGLMATSSMQRCIRCLGLLDLWKSDLWVAENHSTNCLMVEWGGEGVLTDPLGTLLWTLHGLWTLLAEIFCLLRHRPFRTAHQQQADMFRVSLEKTLVFWTSSRRRLFSRRELAFSTTRAQFRLKPSQRNQEALQSAAAMLIYSEELSIC